MIARGGTTTGFGVTTGLGILVGALGVVGGVADWLRGTLVVPGDFGVAGATTDAGTDSVLVWPVAVLVMVQLVRSLI